MGNTLVPENIENVETIDKLFKIYLENISESEEIVKDPLKILSTDFLIEKANNTLNPNYDKVKEELFKIHLEEIFSTLKAVESNEEIYKKFKQLYEALGLPTEDLKVAAVLDEKINEEYINASKSFKSKKGTKAGFFFVYDIINKAGIQALDNDKLFDIVEGTTLNPNEPYAYNIKTTLYKEVVKETVIPLAHPLGFTWNFVRLLFLHLEDFYGVDIKESIKDLVITCYEGETINQEVVTDEKFGTVKSFSISTDQDNNENVTVDFNPLNPNSNISTEQNGLRLVRDFNGRVTLYNRQLSEIVNEAPYNGSERLLHVSNVRLINGEKGNLDIYYETDTFNGNENVSEIRYQEYTIIDEDFLEIEFQIAGDLPDKWYYSTLPLFNKSVSQDKKFFEHQIFDREDIFKNSPNYDGRVERDYGMCLLTYETEYEYTTITSDISEYVKERRKDVAHLPLDSRDDLYQSDMYGEYTGPYNTTDNTVEETDYKDTLEYWGRTESLALQNFFILGISSVETNALGEPLDTEPLIGSDPDISNETYIIGDESSTELKTLHSYDKGWNTLIDNNGNYIQNYKPGDGRAEHFFAPDEIVDLNSVNSRNTVERYIKDNIHNSDYVSKEDSYENHYINFNKKEIIYYNSTESLLIGNDWEIGYESDEFKKYYIGLTQFKEEIEGEFYGVLTEEYGLKAFTYLNMSDNTDEFNESKNTNIISNITDDFFKIGLPKTISDFNIGEHTITLDDDYVIEEKYETAINYDTLEDNYNKDISFISDFNIGDINYIIGNLDDIGIQDTIENMPISIENKMSDNIEEISEEEKYSTSNIITDDFFKIGLPKNISNFNVGEHAITLDDDYIIEEKYEISESKKITDNCDMELLVNSFDIGETELTIGGKTENFISDDFGFGVYRDGILLDDNNISAAA